jgi:predicted acetyltransferase
VTDTRSTTKGDWDEWLPNGKAIVRELVAVSPSAYATLWRYLLDLDLMTKIDAWNRPTDDPLQHLVADPRRLRPALGDALWVRLVDIDRALASRTYAVADSLVIEVVDPVCPWNAGRFSLDVAAPNSPGSSVRRTDRSADITLSAVEVGAIYLGGTRLRDLAAAGFVDEHSPGAVARADRLFAGLIEPWCPEVF